MFEYINKKKKHIKKNHEKSQIFFTCDVCGKVCKLQSYLNWHIDSAHPEKSKSKQELCSECGDTLQNKQLLLYHMLYKHKKDVSSKEYQHYCNLCEFKCRNSKSFEEHERIHTGAKPEICSFCGKAFRVKRTLENHENLHTNTRPYKCQYCEETFVQRTSLKSHIKVHHKNKNV